MDDLMPYFQGKELPAKFRIEIDGVPFSNLSYRQYSVLESLSNPQ